MYLVLLQAITEGNLATKWELACGRPAMFSLGCLHVLPALAVSDFDVGVSSPSGPW